MRHIGGIAALVLTACAGTPNVPHNYVLSDAAGKGLVIGTITSSGQQANYRLIYRRTGGSGAEGYFRLNSDDPTLNGALIAAELPAGDYEIYQWLIRWPQTRSDVYTETVPDAPFSIPFHVEAGRAVYIGSCDFQVSALVVTCADQSDRDLMQFESFFPGLRSGVTLNATSRQPYRSAGYHTRRWRIYRDY